MEKIINHKFELIPFVPSDYPFKIEVKLELSDAHLTISYILIGASGDIFIPKKLNTPTRTTGLWENTCFELFLKNSEGDVPYCELNFSASGQWDCFFFDMLGGPLKQWTKLDTVETQVQIKNELQEYKFVVEKSKLPELLFKNLDIYVSTTTVIKFKNELSYWAIKHMDKKPNFHHPNSYVKLKFGKS